jgi:ATP:corrinoid adenosyltransferase
MTNATDDESDALDALIAIADTVSATRLVKHAFDAGVRAQRRVEL